MSDDWFESSESGPSLEHLDSDDPVDAMLRAMAQAPPVDPNAPDEPQPGQRLAHFVVMARLGAGGMGVVYEAEDERLKRRVALKVLSKRRLRDAASRSLLVREARSAAAVTHPSIAAIYEVGEADGVAFIAMELVRGETLRMRMRAPVRVRDAIDIAWEIARGLARAHQAGIVHRDLKPDNVMLGHDGQVKVLDFGLAKPIDPRAFARDSTDDVMYASRMGHVAGTPAYMSPEQRYGIAVDARSDVFSFGVLLYEMLTSRLPFTPPREGHGTTMQCAELDPADDAPPPPMHEARSDVPEVLEPLVQRCLRRDPSLRFRDGVELAEALAAARRTLDRRAPARVKARWKTGGKVGTSVAIAATLLGTTALAIFAARTHLRSQSVQDASAVAMPASEPPLGVTLKRLTANPAEEPIQHAALSPDGEWLAYVDTKGAHVQRLGDPPGPPAHLALPDKASAELVAWGPSSTWLLVSAALPKGGKRLYRASPDGSVAATEMRGDYTGIAVSPDGRRVAYAAGESVGVMPLDASVPPKELVHKEPGCFITELAWSPGSERIAYVNLCFRSLAQAAIESVAAEGGAPVTVLSDPRLAQESGVGGLTWDAGGHIVYSLAEWFPAENGSNLWSLEIDAKTGERRGAPQRLTSWAGTLASVVSADRAAKRIAFLRFDFQADVYVGELSNGGATLARPQRLTMTDRNERPVAWDAESRGVYFISDRRGLYDIFHQAPGDADARAVIAEPGSETGAQVVGGELLYWQLPKIEAPETVHPSLMRARDGEAPVRVWTATSTSYPEGAGRPQPWEMRFRCARRGCVVSEKEGEALVFRAFDPHEGVGRELRRIEAPTAASFFWDVSPDGERVAMPQENGPVRIESWSGARVGERRVPEGCDPIYVTWSADGRGLFVTAECSNAPEFRLYYVGDAGPKLLWDDAPDWVLNTEVSPDGKRLAIAVKHADNDVWLVER